jgi:hypothetical protein
MRDIPQNALFMCWDEDEKKSEVLGYLKGVTEPPPEDEDRNSEATVHFGGDPGEQLYIETKNLTFPYQDEVRGYEPYPFTLIWDTLTLSVNIKYLMIPPHLPPFKPLGAYDHIAMLRPGRAPLLF